jgi:hypothetical protein
MTVAGVSPVRYPDDALLLEVLQARLGDTIAAPISALARERNPYMASFPTEVVTCRLADASQVRVFCKYGPAAQRSTGHGHRSGVGYEAKVYREVLTPMDTSTPAFLGAHCDGETAWLVLEYLENAVRLSKARASLIVSAARWIGAFHRASERFVHQNTTTFLKVYDDAYYGSWARRTERFAGPLHEEFPWLRGLCAAFAAHSREVLRSPHTVVHGEYYSKNIATCGVTIHPIDWESTAVAPGEIDLATLLEGWDTATTERCMDAYVRARWPAVGDRPSDFERTLDGARLYVAFRWLGDRRSWTQAPDEEWRFADLEAIGVRTGLIPAKARVAGRLVANQSRG